MAVSDSVAGLVIVVRAADERTAACCRALLLREAPAEAVLTVDERPFEAALRRCYKLGIESGAEWMLTVDGDVLARPYAVRDLVRVAKRMPDHYVQVEGLVHDKLNGGYRYAGQRVYRVKHLQLALDKLPSAGAEVRPESGTLERLEKLGHPSQRCQVVFGIHDYEQYHRDLYRKAFVHGVKHPQWLADVVPPWKAFAETDSDFAVAIRGFFDGFQSQSGAQIDSRLYRDRAERALAELGIAEKQPLRTDQAGLAAIDARIGELLAPELKTGQVTLRSRITRKLHNLKRRGLTLDTVGKILVSWGERLRREARRG